jgi:hypothetical protein
VSEGIQIVVTNLDGITTKDDSGNDVQCDAIEVGRILYVTQSVCDELKKTVKDKQ